jgi:hypothetical protein
MKIKIEYELRNDFRYRFVASAEVDGHYSTAVSEISFDDAKKDLLRQLKEKYTRPYVPIPYPEEVEI